MTGGSPRPSESPRGAYAPGVLRVPDESDVASKRKLNIRRPDKTSRPTAPTRRTTRSAGRREIASRICTSLIPEPAADEDGRVSASEVVGLQGRSLEKRLTNGSRRNIEIGPRRHPCEEAVPDCRLQFFGAGERVAMAYHPEGRLGIRSRLGALNRLLSSGELETPRSTS